MGGQLLGKSLLAAIIMMASAAAPFAAQAEEEATSGLPDRPTIRAAALYLVELKSGRVLLEKNSARRLPPASLTKIMTALVALETAPLQEVVKIDGRVLVHRSSLKFQAGEEFLLRDLLTAMLVTSANDACEAVAWHVGGEANRFVAMMNERARAMGLENTHFVNACGFDAPGQYSTAADLAKLTQKALEIPAISMMVRTVMRDIASVDGKRHIALYTTNDLLLDREVTGVKTGYTSKAGRCLIASMFKDDHHLLLVGLNLVNQWEQAAHLLRYGQAVMRAGGE